MTRTDRASSGPRRRPTRLRRVTVTSPRDDRRGAGLLRGSAALAVAVVVMNVATYGFQMVAARLLGPAEYGAVASLMALYLVVGVVQLGLQTTAARRISESPEAVDEIERTMLRVAARCALVLGVVLALLSPVVWQVLRLESIIPALLLAAAAVPITIMGAQAGILQGERRWLPLGVLYLAVGLPRLVVGAIAMTIRPTEGAAMAAVLVAMLAPVTVGWLALRRRGHRAAPGPEGRHHFRAALTETLHGCVALLAFFALTNADIVLARNVLSDHDSGLYAGGLILTKAVLFLPQFVVVVSFPAMSTARERRRTLLRGLGLVGALGVVSVVGAVVLSDVAMIFIGGSDYAAVEERLWLFAILGTELAWLQMLVYSVLARQSRRSAYLMLLAVVVLVALGSLVGSIGGLLLVVAVTDAVLLLALLGLSLWRMRHDLIGTESAAPAQ